MSVAEGLSPSPESIHQTCTDPFVCTGVLLEFLLVAAEYELAHGVVLEPVEVKGKRGLVRNTQHNLFPAIVPDFDQRSSQHGSQRWVKFCVAKNPLPFLGQTWICWNMKCR